MNPEDAPAHDTPANDTPANDTPVDFEQDESVDRAVTRAVREALARHALKGNLVVVWKDGRPALIPALVPAPTPELNP